MSKFVPLCPQVTLHGRLMLYVSTGAYTNFIKAHPRWDASFAQMSALRHVLLYRYLHTPSSDSNQQPHMRYALVTEYGVFICRRSEHDDLKAISFQYDDSLSRNNALREGITFALPTTLSVAVNQGNNVHCNYDNGQSQSFPLSIDCTAALRQIDKAFDAYTPPSESQSEPEEQTEEEVCISFSQTLEENLTKAKQYADFDYAMLEYAVTKRGNIHYSAVDGGSGSNQEESLLRFYFANYARIKDLKLESIVNLHDTSDVILGAEIVAKSEPEESEVYLELSFPGPIDINRIPPSGDLTLSVSPVIRDTQLSALDRIREDEKTRQYFETLLGDQEKAGFTDEDLSRLRQSLVDRDYPMTETQIQAVTNGITSKDAYLVMGPPGTGKTTVILEWVKYFALEKHQRVLIASQNNSAVDNVLKRLHTTPGFDILRIGKASKVAEDVDALRFSNKVTCAREKICRHTHARQEELIRLYEHWSQTYELVRSAAEGFYLQRHFSLKFRPFAQQLQKDYKAILTCIDTISRYRKKILSMADSLKKIRTGAGLWRFVPQKLRDTRLRNRKKVLTTALERERTLRDQINQLISQYNQYSDALYQKRFLPYMRLKNNFQDAQDKISLSYESNEDFFPLKQEEFRANTLQQAKNLANSIHEGLEKLDQTIQALQQWEQDIATTQNYALRNLVLENVNVVGATCISSGKKGQFSDLKYDVTIIDEAGQIRIHDCIVPMTLSKKLIMLGDHKQLPPSADHSLIAHLKENGLDEHLYQASLFEKMYEQFPDSNKIMLDTQFRIPACVADFLSQQFYQNQYKTMDSKRSQRFALDFLSDSPMVLIDTSDSPDRFQYPRPDPVTGETPEGDVWNPYESRLIAQLYRKLSGGAYASLETKILAGLNKQVQNLRDTLAQVMGHNVPGAVSTVDSFQGQECDVVIYSFTRSVDLQKSDEDVLRVGFLSDLRRLNVAMSRAKKVLIIVGDFSYLDAHGQTLKNSTRKNKKFAFFIKDLKETAHTNPPGSQILPSTEILRKLEVSES